MLGVTALLAHLASVTVIRVLDMGHGEDVDAAGLWEEKRKVSRVILGWQTGKAYAATVWPIDWTNRESLARVESVERRGFWYGMRCGQSRARDGSEKENDGDRVLHICR